MKQSAIETMARAYVANGGDKAKAVKECRPAMRNKSDKACEASFDRLYGDVVNFWRRVSELQKQVEQAAIMSGQQLMERWSMLAQADASKLSRVVSHRVACRGCWPDGTAERDEWGRHKPDPSCGFCKGAGTRIQVVELGDTADLGPAELALFDGAKMGKYGIEVKHRSRDEAEKNLARAHGLFTDRLLVGDNNSAPELPPLPDDPTEASRVYANLVKGLK